MTEEEKMQCIMDLLDRMEADNPGMLERIGEFYRMVDNGYDPSELEDIWERYAKHLGLSACPLVIDLYMRSIQEGFPDRTAKCAVRLGLSMESGERECFSGADVAGCLGTSEKEASWMMQGTDGFMSVTIAPWLQ